MINGRISPAPTAPKSQLCSEEIHKFCALVLDSLHSVTPNRIDRAARAAISQAKTKTLNPPIIMRSGSNGIFVPDALMAGSECTFLLTAFRCALDL